MLSFTFFFLATLVVLAYGTQGSLQARYIRKYDALTVGMYRNISLGLTMMPILLFVPAGGIPRIFQHAPLWFAASFVGSLGIWCSFSAAHYLPIGVGTALRQVTHTVTAVILGMALFGEFLSPLQVLLLAGIMVSGISLILIRIDTGQLNPKFVGRGIGLTMLAGVIIAHSFYFLSLLSRETNAFAAAYFWEAGVGAFLSIFFLIRRFAGGVRVESVTHRDAWKILSISLLTILGTAAYASAVQYGPYALVSGLMSLTTLMAVFWGKFLYNERPSKAQLILIAIAAVCIILLKLAS